VEHPHRRISKLGASTKQNVSGAEASIQPRHPSSCATLRLRLTARGADPPRVPWVAFQRSCCALRVSFDLGEIRRESPRDIRQKQCPSGCKKALIHWNQPLSLRSRVLSSALSQRFIRHVHEARCSASPGAPMCESTYQSWSSEDDAWAICFNSVETDSGPESRTHCASGTSHVVTVTCQWHCGTCHVPVAASQACRPQSDMA